MSKLLFNPSTQSIVMEHNKTYYDMRTGSEIENPGKLPKLKPFSEYTKSKFEKLSPNTDKIEIGKHSIDIIASMEDRNLYQLGGKMPRYFWKGYLKLVRENKVNL